MTLSKILENNLSSFKECRTSSDVFKKAVWLINHNSIDSSNDKFFANVLLKCLKRSKTLDAALIYISSFTLNDSKVSNKTLEKKSWFEGNPIHGMECSNAYR